jgi:hypothetical protein
VVRVSSTFPPSVEVTVISSQHAGSAAAIRVAFDLASPVIVTTRVDPPENAGLGLAWSATSIG